LWRDDTDEGRFAAASLTQTQDIGLGASPVLVTAIDGAPVGFEGSGVFLLTPQDDAPQLRSRTMIYEPAFDIGAGHLALGSDGRLSFSNPAANYCVAGLREKVVIDERVISPGDIVSIEGCETTADCSAEAICEKTSQSASSGLCLYKDPDAPTRSRIDISDCREFLTKDLEFEIETMNDTSLFLQPVPTLPSPVEQRPATNSSGVCLLNADCEDGYYCALIAREYPFISQSIAAGSCVRHWCDGDENDENYDSLPQACPSGQSCVVTQEGLPPQCVRSSKPIELSEPAAGPCTSDSDCSQQGERCMTSGPNQGQCGHISECLAAAQLATGVVGRSLTATSPVPRRYDQTQDTCVATSETARVNYRVPLHLSTLPVAPGPLCQRNLIDDNDVFPNPCYDIRTGGNSSFLGYREKVATDSPTDISNTEATQIFMHSRDTDIGTIWALNESSNVDPGRSILRTVEDEQFSFLSGASRGLRYAFESNTGFAYVDMLPYSQIISSTRFSWPTVATQGLDGQIYVLDSGDSGRGQGNQVRRIDPDLSTFRVQSTDSFFVR